MRQGQQNNNKQRMRGRNRKGPNPLTRSYESNGGDVKIRGTALHVAEKYVQLARDAQSSGDRVAGENYLQHAEHYYRIVAAAQAQMPQPQPVYRNDEDGDDEDGQDRQDGRNAFGGPQQPGYGNQNPGSQSAYEAQPHVNGANNGGGQEQPQQGYGQSGEYRNEPRGEGNDNRDRGGGNFRHRRRRPYRDQYNDRGGEQQGGGGAPEQSGGSPEQGGGGGNPEPVEAAPEVRGDE
jgi:hypothetical protein